MNVFEPKQLQLRSLIRGSGELELSLVEIPIPEPGPDEVLVRIEAAPLNPSDQGLLFGAADMESAVASGTVARPVVTATVPAAGMKSMAGRLDQSLPVGNEGAGVVVKTGTMPAARALEGKRVALLAGAMYSQYRVAAAGSCMLLPDTLTSAQGACAFINPLTALGMIDTMKTEGHRALVHTAAASNLGRILLRLCLKEGIELVNIVRSAEHAVLLRQMGAVHVCNLTSDKFVEELAHCVTASGATVAFDAIGGGRLASQILSAMETAASHDAPTYSRYGSTVHKQVYLYGGLDTRPTELIRDFGMSWGIGGWLVMHFMQKIGAERLAHLKNRIAGELATTFASDYAQELSLTDTLRLDVISSIYRRATGRKFLLNPNTAVQL